MAESRETPAVALQQVTGRFARINAGKTLEKPVGLTYVIDYLKPDEARLLEASCPNGAVYAWGSKFERVARYGKLVPGHCLVLFRRRTMVYKAGVVAQWAFNAALGERLWGYDTDGETWSLVYFMTSVRDVSIRASEINEIIGRRADNHWQGLDVVAPPKSDEVIADAQMLLGTMYSTGQGVPQDYVQAHMWFNLSAAQGHEEAIDGRDAMAKAMTPAQIAEAQKLAREWRAKQRE